MSVSLTKSFAPGTVVEVVNTPGEVGYVGFIRRTTPTNGDDVLVGILSPATSKGYSLSYKNESLRPVPKNK